MAAWSLPVALCLVTAACSTDGSASSDATGTGSGTGSATARIVLVGDVMLGRGVAPVVAGDPASVFERLRPVLVDADLALGNLESPLTRRPHVGTGYALEADPNAAALLAGAGFDAMGVANNHAGDAGPATVLDTVGALASAGMGSVGGGATDVDAAAPLVVELGGITVGVLAFDASGGTAATATAPGVNGWAAERAREAVTELRGSVDVVVVGLHGGVEYLPRPDPALARVANLLGEWGADVVWGHGAHVAYPVEVLAGEGRPAVVAPGLGNALFDQRLPRTREGTVLEVLVDGDGVLAMRAGTVRSDAGRAVFDGWANPTGDAVSLDGEWWTPVRPSGTAGTVDAPAAGGPVLPADHAETTRSSGDVTGTGETDTVVAYRRLASPSPVRAVLGDDTMLDRDGRTAHLAVYTDTGRMRWGAAVLFQPIGSLAVCDGSMALGFTTLDEPAVVAGGAWTWDGFGFRTAPLLPGPATPGCVDVDLDGRTDPMLTDRVNATD